MSQRNQDRNGEDGRLYQVEVGGPVPPNRWSWLGAEEVVQRGSVTVLRIRVVDQSDLYGRLRKIHDLNLKLISVQLV